MMKSRFLLITFDFVVSFTLSEKMAGSFVFLSPNAYLKKQIPLISEDTRAKFKELWLTEACL